MTWKDNSFYKSESSEENIAKDSFLPKWSFAKDSLLPEWLEARQGMIFTQNNIEKTHELGTGQYGSVFKGKLIQGNAVYVNYAINYYFIGVIYLDRYQ